MCPMWGTKTQGDAIVGRSVGWARTLVYVHAAVAANEAYQRANPQGRAPLQLNPKNSWHC